MLSRDVTPEEIAAYQADGVVHLPGILDDDWVVRAEAGFEEAMNATNEGLHETDLGAMAEMLAAGGVKLLTPLEEAPSGRFRVRSFNWRQVPALESLGCQAPLPELAAALMGATRINFFGDQLFFKEAGSKRRTAFHQDAPYFHLTGDQCCTIWMPLDVVDTENSVMGYVRGSHRWDVHSANIFVTQEAIPGSSGQPLPDIEGNEDQFDIKYIESGPGDAIVHHVRTVHGSTGNESTRRDRRALTMRYLGDDVRYFEREGAPPDSQRSAELSDGDRMDSTEFPLVWTAAT